MAPSSTGKNHKLVLATENLPRELEGVFDAETYAKSRAYQIDKHSFKFWNGLYDMLHLTLILCLNGMPLAWTLAGRVLGYFGMGPEYEITQSIVFVTILQFYQDTMELPWTVYGTFVLEQKHGFNNQTVGFFVKDQIKGILVKYTLMAIILSGIVFFINWGGDYFFIYTWAFICVTLVVMMTIYPTLIAPLFDTYTPLPDGALKTAIEELASGLQYPLKKIFVVDGSRRSSHSNAYMYGFYKNKRIVLFDTLLEVGLVPEIDAAGEKKIGESSDKKEGTGEGVGRKVEEKDVKEKEDEGVEGKEEEEGEGVEGKEEEEGEGVEEKEEEGEGVEGEEEEGEGVEGEEEEGEGVEGEEEGEGDEEEGEDVVGEDEEEGEGVEEKDEEGEGEGIVKEEEEQSVDGKEKEGDVEEEQGEAAERKEEEGGETVKRKEEGSDGDKTETEKEPKLDAKLEKRKKQGCNQEEIVAVLAHELGHWKYSHVLKNLFIVQLDVLISLYLFSFFLKQSEVYTSFGFDTQPTLIGLIIVFQLLFSPFNTIIGYCMIQLSRRYEYQADAFALMLNRGKALKAALTKLFKDNLAFPIADPLYSALTHSHPTFLERMKALDTGAKKRD